MSVLTRKVWVPWPEIVGRESRAVRGIEGAVSCAGRGSMFPFWREDEDSSGGLVVVLEGEEGGGGMGRGEKGGLSLGV